MVGLLGSVVACSSRSRFNVSGLVICVSSVVLVIFIYFGFMLVDWWFGLIYCCLVWFYFGFGGFGGGWLLCLCWIICCGAVLVVICCLGLLRCLLSVYWFGVVNRLV